MSEQLQPCPFCGTEDHLCLSKCGVLTGDMPDRPYRVVCNHLDHDQVQGPVAYGRLAAIAAWNTRPSLRPEQPRPTECKLCGGDGFIELVAGHGIVCPECGPTGAGDLLPVSAMSDMTKALLNIAPTEAGDGLAGLSDEMIYAFCAADTPAAVGLLLAALPHPQAGRDAVIEECALVVKERALENEAAGMLEEMSEANMCWLALLTLAKEG